MLNYYIVSKEENEVDRLVKAAEIKKRLAEAENTDALLDDLDLVNI